MEMCYDGALVMPNSYAVVNEEEMEYIDGGGWLYDAAISILGGLVACALWEYRASVVKGMVAGVVAAYNWVAGVVSSAAAWAVANPAIAAGILGGVVGFVAGVIVAKL